MKRKVLLTTALSLAICAQINAQATTKNPFLKKRQLNPITQGILQRQSPPPAQRGNAIADRLIGWTIYNDGALSDSAYYKYNGTSRGSALDNNVLVSYIEYGYDPIYDAQAPYPLAISRSAPASKYDTGYIVTIENDTVTNATLTTRGYTGNLLALQYYKSYSLNNGTAYYYFNRQTYNRDAQGNLTTIKMANDTSAALNGSFEEMALGNYKYSGTRILNDSVGYYYSGVLTPSENTRYTYDASGNMTMAIRQIQGGSGWEDNKQHIYTYTADNKLKTDLSQYKNSANAWENDQVDSFTYVGNNLTYNSSSAWDDNTTTWAYGQRTKSYYNAQGNLDSQLVDDVMGSSVDPSEKLTYSYTSFNHYDRLNVYYHDGTAFSTVPDATLKLYYETYNAPTAINAPELATNSISIYPNPAKDVLNIRFKEAPKNAVNVRIYNAMGQLMQNASLSAGSNAQVPVAGLVPGNYTVEISDNATSQHLSFVKY